MPLQNPVLLLKLTVACHFHQQKKVQNVTRIYSQKLPSSPQITKLHFTVIKFITAVVLECSGVISGEVRDEPETELIK